MNKAMHLIGSATRYIPGRHAVQTVYWRSTGDSKGLVKTSKMTFFGKTDPKVDTAEMYAKVRERYT